MNMYYLKTISDRIRIPAAMFGSDIEEALERILRQIYEGRIYREIGMVLVISNPTVLSEGIVIPGDSGVYYNIHFDVLSFVPNVNEVYKAEIKEIVEFGAFASIGPFQGLLHVSQLGKEKYSYDKKAKTLSCREGKTIRKGDNVFVKVSTVSLKSSAADTKIGLTMRPDGLGKLSEKAEKPAAG